MNEGLRGLQGHAAARDHEGGHTPVFTGVVAQHVRIRTVRDDLRYRVRIVHHGCLVQVHAPGHRRFIALQER